MMTYFPIRMIRPFLIAVWAFPCLLFDSANSLAEGTTSLYHAAEMSITADELKRHVDILADDSFEGRASGSQGGRAASGYLREQLEKIGAKPMGDDGDYFQYFRNNWRNILACIPGTDPQLKEEYILLSAHYDHVGYGTQRTSYGPTGYIHNGADDNASGTSALLELVEAMQMAGCRRSILFAFWDGEEQGLLGSKHFIQNPVVPLAQIRALMNMDMVGRLRDHKLTVFGSRTLPGSRRLVSEQNEGSPLSIDFSWEIKANSDHHPFFVHGIPYLMPHTGLHDDYHRPRDDSHKINADGMAQTAQLLFRIVTRLGNQDHVADFRPASRGESPRHRRSLERPLPPPPKRLGLSWKPDEASSHPLIVTRVRHGSAASLAGIRVGDRLFQFGGIPIETTQAMGSAVFGAKKTTTITVIREEEAEPITLDIELAGDPMRVGLSWRIDDSEPEAGIVTRVVSGSPAAHAGLQVGDRIYALDDQKAGGQEQMKSLLRFTDFPITLRIERNGRQEEITLTPSEASLHATTSLTPET